MEYAAVRTRIGDSPDDGPDFDTITLAEFQATGRVVDCLGFLDENLEGVNGRVYLDTLFAIPCVSHGVGWSTVIGNREFQHPSLEMIEIKLYHFAMAERGD